MDLFFDPKFTPAPMSSESRWDLRLQPDSPVGGDRLPIPAEWPDSLRELKNSGDLGALPPGTNFYADLPGAFAISITCSP